MTTTISELKPRSASRSDRERFGDVLALQRAAYLRDGAPSLTKRRSDLKKFKAAMLARRSAIEEAIDIDFGHRSRHETALMEIVGVVQGIDYLARNLRRFMRPSRRRIALDMRFGSNRIEYQPLGVVGVISPWNYPVNLSLMPVVTAIAAGNRVMLKPSKLTPATNAVLASMLGELFPEEQVAMVSGDGTAFSSLPFDHLVFTGSTAVGRAVMKAASENLVPSRSNLAASRRPSSPRAACRTVPCPTSFGGSSSAAGRPASLRTTPWCTNPRSTPSSTATTGW
jgi:coniferyl-aldehyde dehydrogenase